jgi:hypothetical protein
MEKTELGRFCHEYLPLHAEVRARVDATVGARQFAQVMVEEGARAGFRFSEQIVLQLLRGGRDQLQDEQLDAVAGGVDGSVMPAPLANAQGTYLTFTLNNVLISSH